MNRSQADRELQEREARGRVARWIGGHAGRNEPDVEGMLEDLME